MKNVVVTIPDRQRLGDLLSNLEMQCFGDPRARELLHCKLEDAEAKSARAISNARVTMNSKVVLFEPVTGQRRTCTLVYPDDRDLYENSVGVLETLGVRLLGRRVGDVVEVPEGKRKRRFVIESLRYQPELSGAEHL